MSIRFQNVAGSASGVERTRIQLCGRLSVEIDGSQLAATLRGKQVPLLLAYLVLNRTRHVGRDELIGALWPESAPRSQDAALRTLLSRLRSALGGSALAGRDELMLELPEPLWIDVEAARVEIERAHQALQGADARSAWGLAQVPLNIATRGLLPGSQAGWLEPPRRELEDIRLQALEVIGRAGLRLGRTQLASVERAAHTLIEAEPYRESGYVLLMEALAAEGNVAEGLRVFERLRTLLRDELGTMPSPETIAVHERLLRPSRRSRAGGDERQSDSIASVDLPPELRVRARVPLVGRRAELQQLGELWERARRGEDAERDGPTRLVLIAGEAGVGKTRLIAEFARGAHDSGGLVLAGRSAQENVVPYQPFLEALRHYFVNAPFAELRSSAREYGSELARLVPDISRRAPDIPPPDPAEPETERYRLFEAVVGLLAELSTATPVLLVLDDLMWADRPTLLLLRHLARAPEPGRVLVLGAYRASESATGGFGEALADLRRERLVTQLDLEGLSQAETIDLVRLRTHVNPSPEFCKALYEETEGNPFFIEEIVRHLAEAGVSPEAANGAMLQQAGVPEGVSDVILRRLARLDADAVEWLRHAAVIGRDFDAGLLERVVSLDEEQFLNALEEAIAAGLVVESPGRPDQYSFSHALIRETLYDGMSARRRAKIHKRVGETLEADGTDRHLTSLALHFARGAGSLEVDKVIRYALRAGEQASAMLAHEEAAEHYARALDVLARFAPEAVESRCELLLLLGETRVRSGSRQLAWEAFRQAADLAARAGDAASLARAAIGASRRYIQQPGVVDRELIELLNRALEATAGERSLVRVQLLARACGAIYYAPERERMGELSDEAAQIADELDDPEARANACAARRRARWDAAHLRERLETSTEMLTLARRTSNLELELQAHAWLVVDLLEDGDRDAVDAQIAAFTAGAQRLRQPLYLWNATVWRAMRALLAGHLTEADLLATEALAAGAPAEAVTAPQYYAIQILAIRREQLRMRELEDAARQLVQSNPARPAWRAALATLLLESGRAAEARALFEELAVDQFREIPRDLDWMIAMTLMSDVCVALGDGGRAAVLYEQLLPYADVNVVIGLATVCLGSAARFLGKLAATMGRMEDAAEHFERALVGNARLKTPVYLAHAQLDYAHALGSGSRSAGLVAAAARTAAELELPAVAMRARELGERLR